ncbi:DNA adenine methylase [Paenibacillus abyssi]|uniref:DNA methyltransferase n=1 Tax=Paenibacillus abyssi TaxID=1340531 RepID=A0A917LFD5_9BACL|nr:DNA adenine methylase [Paenibacillus abyssi]GGG17898.1 DNA methyltransferase [Paenibacillus abyssi]
MATKANRSGVTSVLRWFGGKGHLADAIINLIPEHHTYIEPFSGGAHVLAQKSPNMSKVEVYNDIDEGVVNFLLQLTDPDKKNRLIERLEQLPTSRVLFDRWRNEPAPDDKFEAAVRYFYILRQSVVPANNEKSGWRFGKVKSGAADYISAVAKLDAFAKRMLRVNYECKDFRYIIDKYDAPNSFLFCDPPYQFRENRYLGNNTEQMHIDLHEKLSKIKGKCLVSYYHSDLIDSLYKDWNRVEIQAVVGNYITTGTRRRETEVLFLNYEPTRELSFF